MKKAVFFIMILFGLFSVHATELHTDRTHNSNTPNFSFDLESNATSHILKLITKPLKSNAEIKIIDESGFIRFQEKFHLNKEIDVSGLKNGLYLIKVYSEHHVAVKRFIKGVTELM